MNTAYLLLLHSFISRSRACRPQWPLNLLQVHWYIQKCHTCDCHMYYCANMILKCAQNEAFAKKKLKNFPGGSVPRTPSYSEPYHFQTASDGPANTCTIPTCPTSYHPGTLFGEAFHHCNSPEACCTAYSLLQLCVFMVKSEGNRQHTEMSYRIFIRTSYRSRLNIMSLVIT